MKIRERLAYVVQFGIWILATAGTARFVEAIVDDGNWGWLVIPVCTVVFFLWVFSLVAIESATLDEAERRRDPFLHHLLRKNWWE